MARKIIIFTFTRAPMTPREVRRRYSNGRVLDVVFKNGYRNKGMWAVIYLLVCESHNVNDTLSYH